MPKLLENTVPKYRFHKSSGQAIVTLNGHDVCLGKYGAPTSRAKYDQAIAEWIVNGRAYQPSTDDLTIVELVDRYLPFVTSYYRHSDGTPTVEQDKIKRSMLLLVELYERTKAKSFGPLALKAVRDAMTKHGWCRNHINQSVGRIRRLFKWAVENEIVPSNVLHGLQAVAGLKAGRSEARESEPVRPVSQDHVKEILPHCSRQVSAMIRLQLITGMRPGEVCHMRGCDIDTTDELWLYRPSQHKNLHRGHERTVYIGPQSKEIVQQFLKPDPNAFLFSPADAEKERREGKHARRKTPLSCGNTPGSNVKKHPKRVPTDHYDVNTYARAIIYACDARFPCPDGLARGRISRNDGKRGLRFETRSEWRTRLETAHEQPERFHLRGETV